MALINCFWSYAHDDAARDERILMLIDDIINEVSLITGEEVGKYFIDNKQLEWGDEWKVKLDGFIDSLPIFIPIITPTYFNRPNCTQELKAFIAKLDNKEEKLNNSLMPILYIDVPELRNADCEDELMVRISSTQYVNWTKKRFFERSSMEYRLSVNEIALELVSKNQELEKPIPSVEIEEQLAEPEDEGFLETVAQITDRLDNTQINMNEASSSATEIGEIFNKEMDIFNNLPNKSNSALLLTFNKISNQISEPVDKMYEGAEEFSNNMNFVNTSIPNLLEFMQFMSLGNDEQKASVIKLKSTILDTGKQFSDTRKILEGTTDSLEPTAKMSRALRPHIRKMMKALNLMSEAMLSYEQAIAKLETWEMP